MSPSTDLYNRQGESAAQPRGGTRPVAPHFALPRVSAQHLVAKARDYRLAGREAIEFVLSGLCGGPRQAFAALDASGSGRVAQANFFAALASLGMAPGNRSGSARGKIAKSRCEAW